MQLLDDIQQDFAKYYSSDFAMSRNFAMRERNQMSVMLISYALLCYWGFHRAKRNADPILKEGKWALRVYNIFQVLFSGYIAAMAAKTYLRTLVSTGVVCQAMDVDVEKNRDYVAHQTYTAHLFYISKLVDIMDTVFIILRGKWRQLTFLHVFHHTSVIVLGWMAVFYHPCGFYFISIQLNAPVHFFMYFYYFLSSFPKLTPYLWWKKYITSLQLTQFWTGTFMAAYCFLSRFFRGPETKLSLIYTFLVIFYGITLLGLFTGFYNETYTNKKKEGVPKSRSAHPHKD